MKLLIHHICRVAIVAIAFCVSTSIQISAQINTEQVMTIGRNALYFEDYLLSIQYFNQVIKAKPYLAEPFFYRAIAKLQLDDYLGAEADCTEAISRNPFITEAYEVRGIARQSMGRDKEAIADYSKGLEYLPEHKTFLLNKGIAEESIKSYDDAEKSFASLIRLYPDFAVGYLGRSQLYLAKGDTVAAFADIDKSISLNNKNANAYAMRADLHSRYDKNYTSALSDMDEAIKLQPREVAYFINRAYLKYNLDDYFGAMSDYDYAIDLDPMNVTARFNRGLFLAQLLDDDKALRDFNFVLDQNPEDVMSLYNRAELYMRTGAYRRAIADFDKVIEKVPDMAGLYYARSECKRKLGDMKGGEADYNKSKKLMKEMLKGNTTTQATASNDKYADNTGASSQREESEGEVKNKFKQLLTVETDNTVKPEYDRKARGRVQDNSFRVDAEPQFVLSYYQVVNELRTSSNYVREITDLNEVAVLPFALVIANSLPNLSEDQINKHFSSVEYYTGLISSMKVQPVDYFARAIDFMVVKNYDAAIADLDKAVSISDKFMLAYFARANAKYYKSQALAGSVSDYNTTFSYSGKLGGIASAPSAEKIMLERAAVNAYTDVIADLDKVIELSPRMIYAYYNKGCLYLETQNYTEAIAAFNKAIEIKPDFGEAYYNRGLVYLRLGNKENGSADLSKAGELGILPSYSVLKRMNR